MSLSGKNSTEFQSALSRNEMIAVLCYLPVHCFVLPRVLSLLFLYGYMEEATANLMLYVIGGIYMLCVTWRFLRRDFDPFIDRFMNCVLQVAICYGLMIAMNMVVNGLLLNLDSFDNPNNIAIMDAASMDHGKMTAMAVFLAPIVEEILFRAGIFGLIRPKSRFLAYAASILAFALYHVWPYAVLDARNWIFIAQYIPASYLLCRCYEKCNSIWGNIAMHMVVNGISLKALSMVQEIM